MRDHCQKLDLTASIPSHDSQLLWVKPTAEGSRGAPELTHLVHAGCVCLPWGYEESQKSSLCAEAAPSYLCGGDRHLPTHSVVQSAEVNRRCVQKLGHTHGEGQELVKETVLGRGWAPECENTRGILEREEESGSYPVWMAICVGCGSQPWLPTRIIWRKKYRGQTSYVLEWVVVAWMYSCVKMNPLIH